MDKRFEDNQSPEPSIKFESCYQTPEVTGFTHLNSNIYAGLYPTPPSDSDETRFTNQTQHSNSYTSRDSTGQYYGNSFSNHSDSSSYSPPDLAKNLYGAQDSSYITQSSIQESTPNAEAAQNSTGSRFKRRSRTTYSKAQLDVLEKSFQKSHYPEIKAVDDLCDLLKLSTERISIWFQNRRARFKKARKIQAQKNGYASVPQTKTEKIQVAEPTTAPVDFQANNKYFYGNSNIESFQNMYSNSPNTLPIHQQCTYLPIKENEENQNIIKDDENIKQSNSYVNNPYINSFPMIQPNFNHQYYQYPNVNYQGNYLMPYSYQN